MKVQCKERKGCGLEASKVKVGFKEVEVGGSYPMTAPFLGVVTWPGVSVFYDFDVKVSKTSVWINRNA